MDLDRTPFGNLAAYGDTRSQVVSILADGRSIATVSADRVLLDGIDGWWINRALVRSPERRSRGLGSFILTRLKRSIERVSDCRVMLVSPSGYSGETKKQYAFYERNGFVPSDTPGLLICTWEPAPLEAFLMDGGEPNGDR